LDDDPARYAVEFHDGTRTPISRFIVIAKHDLAISSLINIPSGLSKVQFLDIGAMSDALLGEPLLIWGSPFGYGPSPFLGTLAYRLPYKYDDATQQVTRLEFISEDKSMEEALATARMQGALLGFISASGIAPGVSGSPAFDEKGRFFGLIGSSASFPDDRATGRATGIVIRSALENILHAIDSLNTHPPHR